LIHFYKRKFENVELSADQFEGMSTVGGEGLEFHHLHFQEADQSGSTAPSHQV